MYVIFATVKTKNKTLLLRFFSALMCFHFLNISVETHKYFFTANTLTSEVIPETEKGTACLVELMFDMDIATQNSLPENSANLPDNSDGEEEEKKFTDDEFYFLHLNYCIVSDSQNAHRFHGVSDTKEFISEIIPPPPKA